MSRRALRSSRALVVTTLSGMASPSVPPRIGRICTRPPTSHDDADAPLAVSFANSPMPGLVCRLLAMRTRILPLIRTSEPPTNPTSGRPASGRTSLLCRGSWPGDFRCGWHGVEWAGAEGWGWRAEHHSSPRGGKDAWCCRHGWPIGGDGLGCGRRRTALKPGGSLGTGGCRPRGSEQPSPPLRAGGAVSPGGGWAQAAAGAGAGSSCSSGQNSPHCMRAWMRRRAVIV